jgi:hypothetical protein
MCIILPWPGSPGKADDLTRSLTFSFAEQTGQTLGSPGLPFSMREPSFLRVWL